MKIAIVLILAVVLLAVPVASASATGPSGSWVIIHHEVVDGDTWYSIGVKYGASATQVAALNGNQPLVVGNTVQVAARAAAPVNDVRRSYPGWPRNYQPGLWR